jgi:ATP-dependent Lon protease
VRNLEREIANICRKAARRLAEGKKPLTRVTPADLPRYLGPPRYPRDEAEEKDEVGLAMGLAWTEAGGDLMPVEVALMPGKGNPDPHRSTGRGDAGVGPGGAQLRPFPLQRPGREPGDL